MFVRYAVRVRFVVFALGLVGVLPVAELQAQDWGLTRMRPSRMTGAMRGSRMNQTGMRTGRAGARMNSRMTGSPTMGTNTASNAERPDRNRVLITRYRAILRRDPRETFAFQRLLDLYRERDGNVDGLVHELEQAISNDAQAYPERMLLGHVYKAQGRTADARRLYEASLALRTDEPAPALALARIAQSSGEAAVARRHFEQALQHTRDPNGRTEILRDLGAIALEANDYEGAEGYFRELSRGAGSSVYLKTEYARALSARNEHRRAVAEYERVMRTMRGDNRVLAPVLREMAQAQLEAGDKDDAIATIDRALRIAGRTSGVRRELYDVLVEVHRRADELPQLAQRLARLTRRDFDAVELLGRVHDELGNEEEALAAYRRALALNRRHIDTRVRIIQLLSRSGRLDDVIAEYRELVRVAPRQPRFVVELAQLLMEVGRRDEALRLTEQTARQHRRDPSVHQALAELYARWGETERATREVAALVRIDPRDPGHLIALGEQQLDEGNRQAALATWRRILTVDSDRGRANSTLAAVLADHDMLDDAERYYRVAVEAEPDRVDYLRGLATVMERPRAGERNGQRQQRNLEAVEFWTRVLRLAEDRPARREARQRIVGIWARQGELATRIDGWRRALRANPPDANAGRFLAEAYLRSQPRRLQLAEATLERVIRIEPGDVESLIALERVRTAGGKLAEAIEVLQLLVEADARHAPRYLQRMASHAHSLYRDEDAVRFAAAAVSHTPDDAEGHRRLGDLYRARQDLAQAIESYRRAIELNDRLFATYFDLAELHLARGELAEADRLYRAVLKSSPDDDLVARAGRSSVQIHLGEGTLDVLERDLLPLAIGQPRRPIFRKLVVALYDSLTAPLIQASGGDDEAGRIARTALSRLGGRAIKPLLEALADSDPAQQRIAIDVLGYLGNPNAAGPLLAAVASDAPPAMRWRALAAAGAVAPPELAPRFAELAAGPEQRLRFVAAWALARLGRPAVPAMRELSAEGDASVRAFAALGLGRAGDTRSVDLLTRLLREDRSPAVKAASAWALGEVGDGSTVSLLVSALRRENGLPSRAAASALGAIASRDGSRRRQAHAALVEALFEPDSVLRRAAATALVPGAERASTFSVPRTSSVSDYVAAMLAGPAGAVPVDLEPLAPALETAARRALRGPVERVLSVLEVLAAPPGLALGLGPLTATFDGWPEADQQAAATELAAVARALADDLVAASQHPEPTVRELAVRRLSRVDSAPAVGALVAALDDPEAAVQRAALSALDSSHAGHPQLVEKVRALSSRHADWSTRLRAVQTLGRLGDEGAIPTLVERLRNDEYAFVREAAARALGALSEARRAPNVRAALDAASRGDSETRVRRAAAAAQAAP